MNSQAKISLVACGGMDKAEGSVTTQITFLLLNQDHKAEIALITIPQLCAGISPYPTMLKTLPVVVIDGCGERCATKIVARNQGRIRIKSLLTKEIQKFKKRPQSQENIGQEGMQLAELVASDIQSQIEDYLKGEHNNGK